MSQIDLKFMKGNRQTAKAMGSTYTKKKAAKPTKKAVSKKK